MTLKEIAPQGHAVLIKTKKGYRTKLVAENIKMLQDSKQVFDNIEIANANIQELVKMFGGDSIIVLDKEYKKVYRMSADGGRKWYSDVEVNWSAVK